MVGWIRRCSSITTLYCRIFFFFLSFCGTNLQICHCEALNADGKMVLHSLTLCLGGWESQEHSPRTLYISSGNSPKLCNDNILFNIQYKINHLCSFCYWARFNSEPASLLLDTTPTFFSSPFTYHIVNIYQMCMQTEKKQLLFQHHICRFGLMI